MISRSVDFDPTSPYGGWTLTIDQGAPGSGVLVQVQTSRHSVNGAMSCAMVLKPGTAAWQVAVDALTGEPDAALDDTLTAILNDLPEHAAAYQVSPLRQAHIGLIAAAGAHARRAATNGYDRPTATAVLPRRNPQPHNWHGTTDDFYG